MTGIPEEGGRVEYSPSPPAMSPVAVDADEVVAETIAEQAENPIEPNDIHTI